ncbi:MAG: hypothetical protein JWQ86_4655 [Mycobacterium sp.]|nr:hypothetical protein [Mycobacterium sp.]
MAKAASSPNGAKSGSHATSSGTTAPTAPTGPKPSAARAVALVGAADFRAGDHEHAIPSTATTKLRAAQPPIAPAKGLSVPAGCAWQC